VHGNYIVVQVLKTLCSTDIHHLNLLEVEEHFHQHEHPFVNLETQYQQMKCYKETFNLIVSSNYFMNFLYKFHNDVQKLVLGKHRLWKGNGVKDVCLMKTVLCM